MSSSSVSLKITGNSNDLEAMLIRVTDALDVVGMYAFLNASVGPWLRQRAQARFANEGDDVVGQWAPLQSYTIALRQSMGYGGDHPINKRTGELENYIVNGGWDVMSTSVGSQLTYPGNSPNVSEALKVATAQMGATYPSTQARPVLGLNEADLAFVLAALATHVTIASRL